VKNLLKIIETIFVIPLAIVGGVILAAISIFVLPIYLGSILIEDIWGN